MNPKTENKKRLLSNWHSEKEAAGLYRRMAAAEKNPEIKTLYMRLAATEERHIAVWEDKLLDAMIPVPAFRSGFRSRLFGWLAEKFGPSAVVQAISKIETAAASGYDGQADAEAAGMPSEERSHARVFSFLATNGGMLDGRQVARLEGRHKSTGGNALRAGVLGANDGLISVFNLVMGVAGAGMANSQILLTGLAGLLAGALSMALGEWLSVQSSRELNQHQIDIERRELEESPEGEAEELALIYQAKGLPEASAREMADRLLSNRKTALDTLAREELGIDPEDMGGSAWEAAITSFILFCVGAIIPVFPYFFLAGMNGIIASTAASTVGLFGIGAAITVITGQNPLRSGIRQVLFGLATAFITFGIGKLIGVSIS